MNLKVLLAGIVAAAAVSGTVSAAPCMTASYSTYLVAGFSCTVADQTYSSFSFDPTAGGSGVAPTSDDITAAPEMTSHGPGLIFSSSAISVSQSTSIGSDTFIDVALGFTVTSGAALLDDAALDVAGSVTGNGTAMVTETVSTLPPGPVPPPMQVGVGGDPPSSLSSVIDFGPVPVVNVSKNIFVQVPPETTGSATVTSITQEFSQVVVPEPGSLALLSTALTSLVVLLQRRKRDQSGEEGRP